MKKFPTDETEPGIYLTAYARGLDPDPTEEELREAIDLLRQHKMHAAAFALMEVEHG
jgi:hypothetical protein